MGQTIGRAPLPTGSTRFLNLPRKCVFDLWEAFNDVAEGFGLTVEEFQEIVKSATLEHLSITERQLNLETDSVFRLLDDDSNNLIDSLEFLSAFSIISGMTPEEKIRFIFAMYDFDESGVLTLDEMVLSFRSSLSGLSKLSKIDPPTEVEVEAIVVMGFDAIAKLAQEIGGIDRESYVSFCLNTPEVMSWIEYFDDLDEYVEENAKMKPVAPLKLDHLTRSKEDTAVRDATYGGYRLREYERRGKSGTRRSWENVMPLLAPARIPELPPKSLPKQNLKLEWAYGFNAHSSRQALYYSAKGEAIYGAGAVCVVQSINKHTQQFFHGHTDLITCIKVYHTEEGATVIASGESGRRPAIHIWDCETKTVLSTLQGFHRNGVAQLDFSPDTTKLVTLGMDLYHSIAIYKWASRERIFAARTTSDVVHDVRFISNDTAASCGEKHVLFWKESKPDKFYKRYRGNFGSAVKPETLTCVNVVGNVVFTCSDIGMIYLWEGRNLVHSIRAHTSSINACYAIKQGTEHGAVTVCSAGKVLVWNAKMELGATFNASSLGAIENSIVSICYDVLTSKILVGFKTSEIFEMDATDGRNIHNGGSVVSSHFKPRLYGLACHPTQPNLFCTVGDDKTIRIFDANKKKLLRVCMLDTMGHSVCYSNDGQILIVGLGSGIDGQYERKEGAFIALSEEDLTLLHEARDSKNVISDCKFSPNGDKFCLASHDGCLYVYATKKYASKAKCRGHTGKVEHFDFSTSGQYVMSNCSNDELLFFETESGELMAPKTVKNAQWETNSCSKTYYTQGIWEPLELGLKYNACCKSNSQEFIVAVDNFGRIRIAEYPCLHESPAFVHCHGHSKEASNVKLSCDDNRLFTTGATDGTILQWKVTAIDVQNTKDMLRDENFSLIATPMFTELNFEGKILEMPDFQENVLNSRPVAIFEMEEGIVDVNDLQPWQKTIVAPSRVPIEDNSEPADRLELEFVHGYSADISRQNVMYAPNGDLIFFAASIAIVMNQKLRTQKYYNKHKATITCMTVNRTGPFVATGEQKELPAIHVWNTETFDTVAVLESFHRRAISLLKFSANGKYLVSVGMDALHSVAVYDWANQQIICSSQSFENKCFAADFAISNDAFIQCGNEIIRFWDIDGRNLHYNDAMLGTRAKLQSYMCAGWIGNSAIVGTAEGSLYRFLGNKLDSIVKAHSGAINCISYVEDGLATSSIDGLVKIWTRFLECRLIIDTKNLGTVSNDVRTVDWDFDLARVLLGTASAEIYEVGSGDGENIHEGPLVEGHGGDELWGLAVNPTKEEFCTVGDDAFLRIWTVFGRKTINTVSLEMPARCCAYSPDGKFIAVGFGSPRKLSNRQFDGKWVVIDVDDYQVSHEARDSTKWIKDIKYSPNGETIAMGCYDNKIYIYSVTAGYALNAVIGQHNSFIVSLDFSEDNAWIQSNCGGFELFYFEADTGLYIPAAARLRDQAWATHTCPMTWATQGAWPAQKDGTDITACDVNLFRGSSGAITCVGDNYGRIRLFRYPAMSSFSNSKCYWMSAKPITRLKFTAGDSYVISISADKAIMQWSHKRDREEGVAHDVLDRKSKVDEDDDDVVNLFGANATADATKEGKEDDTSHLITSRPWIAAMVAPSDASKFEPLAPVEYVLAKNHILGLQSHLTRSSVRFNNAGDILYPASKFVCVYSKKSNSQIFYEGHKNELCCVTVSRDGLVVASAEKTLRPQIHLWDSATCQVIAKLPAIHRRGVVYMQFSNNGKKLVSVGVDLDHSIALWTSPSGSWTDGHILAWTRSDPNPSLFCSFYEQGDSGQFLLASGGRFNQKFWTLNGKCINPQYAIYDKKTKLGTLLCGCAVGSRFVSGSNVGHIYVWVGRTLDRIIRAHELGVTCIWACSGGMVTGAKDGVVKLWNLDLEHVRTFALSEADVPPVIGGVRSLDGYMAPSHPDVLNRIVVSTNSGEIFELSAKSGSMCLVHEAHYTGQLWGMAVHPTDPDLFVTTGDDKTIRVWSISGRRLLRKALIDCTARSVAFSPDGSTILVGMGGLEDGKRQRKDGSFLLLDAHTMKPIFEGRDSRHWLSDVKFSPDNQSFALGSMDHKIYLYNAETFRLKGTCDRHNGAIADFDFSADSVYIQSDSSDYEHLYFEAEDGSFFSAGSQLKDIKWSQWTCKFGWPMQGVWPLFDKVEKGLAFEPSAVHRSPDNQLLAVGDKSGAVKLMNYPAISKDAPVATELGHVNPVAKVRFSCDGRYLLSMGKLDRCIIIWKVLPHSSTDA